MVTRKAPSTESTVMPTKLILICLLSVSMPLLADSKPSLLQRIKDGYREGRRSAEEKRIISRKEAEKLRRRMTFERNVKTLIDGIAKRLKHRRSTVSIVVIGGVVLVVWLCHQGSVGCDGQESNNSFNTSSTER